MKVWKVLIVKTTIVYHVTYVFFFYIQVDYCTTFRFVENENTLLGPPSLYHEL